METITCFKEQWFANPDWWFTKDNAYDEVITHRFQHLLNTTYNMEDTTHDPLATILVYDQLPRHLLRNTLSNHIIEYYLQKALDVISTTNTTYKDALSAIEWTFFMLPLRHTKEPQCIKQVIACTWEKIQNTSRTDEDLHIYKRFIKATYQRFLIDVPSQLPMIDIYTLNDYDNVNCRVHIQKSVFEEILAFRGDATTCKPTRNIQIDTSLFMHVQSSAPIILSLSGGVDSMVCSWLLAKGRLQRNVVAVHVNYDNRPQCSQEVLFLTDWCRQLGIPLYVRKIDEIHRAPCMTHELRDLYESYTRDVRYATYKSIHTSMPQVVLGHNKDDCLENIMTNICHKNKYDNLYGMQPSSVQDGINFIRPLLSISKDEIIAFAKATNIPFLPNSTPTWSQRGQIRNSIVPCLDKWDQRFVPSLFALTDTFKELHDILHARVRDVIESGSIQDDEHHITYTNTTSLEKLPCESMFWREFFFELFKVHVSTNSLSNLKETIERAKKNIFEERKIVISKHVMFTVQCVGKGQVVHISIVMKR